jgi:hypothetical protein
MSKEKDLIEKLKVLIEERERTIKINKQDMKDYLVKYRRALDLEEELVRECRHLRQTIRYLKEQKQFAPNQNNIASNRDMLIVSGDEEQDQ